MGVSRIHLNMSRFPTLTPVSLTRKQVMAGIRTGFLHQAGVTIGECTYGMVLDAQHRLIPGEVFGGGVTAKAENRILALILDEKKEVSARLEALENIIKGATTFDLLDIETAVLPKLKTLFEHPVLREKAQAAHDTVASAQKVANGSPEPLNVSELIAAGQAEELTANPPSDPTRAAQMSDLIGIADQAAKISPEPACSIYDKNLDFSKLEDAIKFLRLSWVVVCTPDHKNIKPADLARINWGISQMMITHSNNPDIRELSGLLSSRILSITSQMQKGAKA